MTVAEDVVLQLFVDDGVPSRGHRTNIMKPEFKFMGSNSGGHAKYGSMTAIGYAAGFKSNGKYPPIPEDNPKAAAVASQQLGSKKDDKKEESKKEVKNENSPEKIKKTIKKEKSIPNIEKLFEEVNKHDKSLEPLLDDEKLYDTNYIPLKGKSFVIKDNSETPL